MRHLVLTVALSGYITSCFALCSSQIESNTPNSRYQILGDGSEVKDLKTGLIWQRCSLGQHWAGSGCDGAPARYTWPQALATAKTGGDRWRLPNVKELYSLVNIACYNPAINEPIFPDTANNGYWSSSPSTLTPNSAADPAYAWTVNFGAPFLGASVSGTTEAITVDIDFMVRLVRDSAGQ